MSWTSTMQQADRLHFCPFCKSKIGVDDTVEIYYGRYFHITCFNKMKSKQNKLTSA